MLNKDKCSSNFTSDLDFSFSVNATINFPIAQL